MDPILLAHAMKIAKSAKQVRSVGSSEHVAFQFDVHDALDYLGAQIDKERKNKCDS